MAMLNNYRVKYLFRWKLVEKLANTSTIMADIRVGYLITEGQNITNVLKFLFRYCPTLTWIL
jgi:hypothetical protein